MPLFLKCNCEGCGKKFELTDDYVLCLTEDKLVEKKFPPMQVPTSSFCAIKGHITQTYCNNCKKFIKIYTPHYWEGEYKEKSIEEIKEYLSHKRPRKYINVFMEEFPSDKIVCPRCNNEVNLDYRDMDKCPKCGSEKFDALSYMIDY